MPKTILVADDNPAIRKALCEMFEVEEDYDICAEATNGEEAIALAKKHKPDLIILDLSMPIMNGLDAARELKRILPQIPIILFTVHAAKVRQTKDLPVDRIVEKTGGPNLINHVRSLIPV
jgi:CheY-like chemotaxis protein